MMTDFQKKQAPGGPGHRPGLQPARIRPLPRQHLPPARLAGHRPPDHPARGQDHPPAPPARGPGEDRLLPARPRPGHGDDGERQDDDPGRHARLHQHLPPGKHHHHRGPDRVPAQGQEEHDQPEGGGHGRHRIRPGPAGLPPRGPRRHPGGRDARPGHDRDGPPGGRDRPPRLQHPPHPGRSGEHQPHHLGLRRPITSARSGSSWPAS